MSLFSRKKSAFFAAHFLFSFLMVQSTFIPDSYSLQVQSFPAPSQPEKKDFDFKKDATQDELTFIDRESHTFAVFADENSLDIPTRMGRVEKNGNGYRLVTTRIIKTFNNFYAVSDPQNSDFVMVSERLPEGGFGRLLRYRGPGETGAWVDLEFIYQDRDDKVTILDYGKGKFYRTTFAKNSAEPPLMFPLAGQNKIEGDLIATQTPSLKFIGPEKVNITPVHPSLNPLPLQFEISNGQDLWLTRLVRGPPVEGAYL